MGGRWHTARQEEGDNKLVLRSKVQAAFAGWEVSPAIGSCVEQGTCVGFAVKARGAKVDLLSMSPRTFEWTLAGPGSLPSPCTLLAVLPAQNHPRQGEGVCPYG